MSTSRRLAAILAADVVGYSRLIELDETGTLAALRERRKSVMLPAVATHRGRNVKVMGDGGACSAVNAVNCAIELQKQFVAANAGTANHKRIDLRVGVNLGDVVVESGDLYSSRRPERPGGRDGRRNHPALAHAVRRCRVRSVVELAVHASSSLTAKRRHDGCRVREPAKGHLDDEALAAPVKKELPGPVFPAATAVTAAAAVANPVGCVRCIWRDRNQRTAPGPAI